MTMITVHSSGPAPERSKGKIFETPLAISYGGKFYRIKRSKLRNLGLDNLDAVRASSIDKGMDPIPDFRKNCVFCNYVGMSFDSSNEGVSVGEIDECSYAKASKSDLRIATSFTHKGNGSQIMALEDACVFNEALVEALAEKGALADYEVQMPFNYQHIDTFENSPPSKEFQIRGPVPFYSSFQRFLNFFKKS